MKFAVKFTIYLLFHCLVNSVNSEEFSIRQPLCTAAAKNDVNRVTKLIEKGAKPSKFCTVFHAERPLDIAAKWGYFEVGERLIQGGADVDSKGWFGYTPSLHAAENVHGKFLRLLLENGADVNVQMINTNLLSKAAIGYIVGHPFLTDTEKIALKEGFFEVVDALHQYCFDVITDGAFALKRLSGEGYNDEAGYILSKRGQPMPDDCISK